MPKKPSAEAIADLKESLRASVYKGADKTPRVFMIQVSRSASGMSRIIRPIIFTRTGPHFIGYRVAEVLGIKYDREREGLRISGVGMDMGFWLADSLSLALYGKHGQVTKEWL